MHRVVFNGGISMLQASKAFPRGVVVKAKEIWKNNRETVMVIYHGSQINFPPHFLAVHY